MVGVVPLDRTHITLRALEDLLPEASVAGGSFAADLQHPLQISRSERKSVFENAQSHAIDSCIQELCVRVGLTKSTRVTNGAGGERLWPTGYVGSLSHKGTVVLGALAEQSAVRTLGIDLEFIDSSKLGSIKKNVAWEGLPPGIERSRGVLLALSAKEAFFKAQYPLRGKSLGFSDVALVWTSRDLRNFSATVECSEMNGLEIRCTQIATWIISVAVMLAKPQASFFSVSTLSRPTVK